MFLILGVVTVINLVILGCSIGVLLAIVKLHTETSKQATLRAIRDK